MASFIAPGSGSITVTADSNNITITSTGNTISIPISGFNSQSSTQEFINEQIQIRFLDCIKDAKGVSKNVNEILTKYYPNTSNFTGKSLDEIFDETKEKNKHKISKCAWTKIAKNSPLGPKIISQTVFKESGLTPGYFISKPGDSPPSYCGNFANEVVDPATRSEINPLKGDVRFPEPNTTLILDQSFMKLFGFIGCSVNATYNGSGYTYEVVIGNPKTKIDQSNGNKYFIGNAQKNQTLKDLQTQNDDEKLKLIIAKEMGDVLQVLIMFIWSEIEKNRNPNSLSNYTMVTCDRVVYLQCMLLNLNCVLTNAEKEENNKITKLRNIEIFDILDTDEHQRKKFENEKNNIMAHNKNFIECIEQFINNPDTHIFVTQINKYIIFDKQFYQDIHTDLNEINNALQTFYSENVNLIDTNNIEYNIKIMKNNFLIFYFIRKHDDKIKFMCSCKKYTKQPDIVKLYNLSNYGKDAIFNIGMNYGKYIEENGKKVGEKRRRGGNNFGDSSIFDKLEFEDTAVFFDEDSLQTNLYDYLYRHIKLKLKENEKQLIVEIYNELLHEFYLQGEVIYYGDNNKDSREFYKNIIENVSTFYDATNYNKKQKLDPSQHVFNFGKPPFNKLDQPFNKLLRVSAGKPATTTKRPRKTKKQQKKKRQTRRRHRHRPLS
jgi:hypothetical protein